MYLIKDSRAAFVPHFVSQHLSPPQPVSPPAPNAKEQGQGERAASPGPEGCPVCISHRLEALLVGVSCVSGPTCTNFHGIRIQPTLYFHTLKATRSYPRTSWKGPSLPEVFPPQSHPNAGTDPELGFWGRDSSSLEISYHLTQPESACVSKHCSSRHHSEKRSENCFQCLNINSVHVHLQFSAATLMSCCGFEWQRTQISF